jgi:hypothetical protein
MATNFLKKKLFGNIEFWHLIICIIGAIIIPIIIFYGSKNPDFQVTFKPNVGEVVRGGSLQTKVIVESQKYKNNIKLTTKSQSDKISIIIDSTNGMATPKFESNVTIKVAGDAKEGDYEIELVAVGAKNKIEHSSVFFLNVKNSPFIPQPLSNLFYPDGFMGDVKDIQLELNSTVNPYSGSSCIQIKYNPRGSQKWAGIYWLYPNFNWGNQPQGRNLTGAKSLVFMARGNKSGEIAEFKVGGVSERYTESLYPAESIGVVTLTSDWKEYSIDLSNKDLSNVFGGFCWVTNTNQNPNGCTIYIDNISFK